MTWWSGKWAGDDERSNCASIGDTHPSVLRSNAAPELCTCLVSTSRARTRTDAAPYLEVLASSKAPRASIFVDKTLPCPAHDFGKNRCVERARSKWNMDCFLYVHKCRGLNSWRVATCTIILSMYLLCV